MIIMQLLYYITHCSFNTTTTRWSRVETIQQNNCSPPTLPLFGHVHDDYVINGFHEKLLHGNLPDGLCFAFRTRYLRTLLSGYVATTMSIGPCDRPRCTVDAAAGFFDAVAGFSAVGAVVGS